MPSSPEETRFRELIEKAADGVLVLRPDGTIAYANPEAGALLGRPSGELQGAMFGTPVDPGATTEIDLRQGHRVAEMRVVAVEWEGQPAALATLRDVTERHRAARDTARRYDEAQEGLRRRDEFLAMLAHELRNPLAPILTAARVMHVQGTGNETLEKARATIERQALHLSRLLDDLLDLSRVAHGKIELRLQSVDLAGVVRDAVQVVTGFGDLGEHELVVDVAEPPLMVEGDPTRLTQVVGNLLTNAIRYTAPGGRIEVCARREDDAVVVRVADNGEGIAREMLSRIFDPFVQLHGGLARSKGGLGVGLTLVQQLVQLHRGSVTASSPGPGLGSVFEVRLPWSPGQTAVVETAPVEATPLRILIVEDNVDGREMLADLLRLWGHTVDGVGDGAEALQRMRTALPDCALIDIGLPGLNGYQLAQEIRQLPGGSAVLLLAVTGYGQPADRESAQTAGFDGHVLKPVDLNELARLLVRKSR